MVYKFNKMVGFSPGSKRLLGELLRLQKEKQFLMQLMSLTPAM